MSNFTLLITDWYRLNKRNLPWRNSSNPYFIWLSEIILQQTRVEQGTSYYLKFIKNYPTVEDLANADEQDILNDWQGLGYYSRARNLHYSAKMIRDEFKGVFPNNYNDIIKLKGVGQYTASAISSFAFNESKAVVDGNVYRLLSRVFNIDTPIDSTKGIKEFQELADELIDPNNPANHNQAIMEVGAIVCTPKSPNCNACPLIDICLSRENHTIDSRPVKQGKVKVTDRFFHYLVFSEDNKTLIQKRTEKGIWQNMYQFPLLETPSKQIELSKELDSIKTKESSTTKHILSHQRIHTVFHHFNKFPSQIEENWKIIDHRNIQDYPLPRVIDRYLEEQDVF